ncbi:MAG: hypothetical protein GX359_03725 [Clostridiales bacterium]|nr:hypothetical protein [Clostridiales bacterium]
MVLGEVVEHKKYKTGVIVKEEVGKVEVEFDGIGTKRFQFPEAFCKYLKLKDPVLQNKCLRLAEEKKKRLEAEAEKLRLEREKQEEERQQELLREKQEELKRRRAARARAKKSK